MQSINLNLVPGSFQQVFNCSQGDIGRQLTAKLFDGSTAYEIPAGSTVKIKATKPSGFGFDESATFSGSTVTITTAETMTNEWGRFPAELVITKDGNVIGTANFLFNIEKNPHPDSTVDGDAEEVIPELTLLVERVEAAASSVLDMEVVATTLPAGSQASYSYDEDLNKATFGIPQGEAGAGAAGVVASAYSSSKTYKVGDYVIHNSNLYRCITAITTAEAFTAAHWTQNVLADDVSDLKTDLQEAIDEFAVPTQEAVDNWLEAHPEATTTVEDHSLTYKKLVVGTLGYVTPEMFGAKGDGTTDDTTSLQAMFDSGVGYYLLKNTYAISSPINISGNIFGDGKVLSKNYARISGGLFNVVGDICVEGIIFDCQCSQSFIESDYGNAYNCAIYSASNNYDVRIQNIKCINGYASAFVYLYGVNGNITIKNSIFKAEGINNKWSGYMISMQTIGGTDNIDIIGNRFYGNGDAVSNFAGIFMANITTRKKINIGNNFFNGVGRNKSGGHQSHCIDAYWDVSHLNVFNNVMINNAYCCLRIHGGDDFDIHGNYFGNVNSLTTDACVLVQDDKSSTGANPVGVSNVGFRNNVFKSSERYECAIQLSSDNSAQAGIIQNVIIDGNYIDGVYNHSILIDGSVKQVNISCNTIKSTRGGVKFKGITYSFTDTSNITISDNFFEIKGSSTIYGDVTGDILLKIVSNYFRTYGYAVNLDVASSKVSALHNTIVGSSGFNNAYTVGGNIIEISNTNQGIVGATRNFGNYINGTLSQ